jgi:hypothetical protein
VSKNAGEIPINELEQAYMKALVGAESPSMGWITCEECGQVYPFGSVLCTHLVTLLQSYLKSKEDPCNLNL